MIDTGVCVSLISLFISGVVSLHLHFESDFSSHTKVDFDEEKKIKNNKDAG